MPRQPNMEIRKLKIIYLDQLHWIEIAKSVNGKTTKVGTQKVIEYMSQLSSSGLAVFPLSISHYYETLKQTVPERRQRLANVMRSMSRGYTVAALNNVVKYEVRSSLISMLNLDIELEHFKYLGKNLGHALGENINFNLVWPNSESVPEDIRNKIEDDIFNIVEDTLLSGSLKVGEVDHVFTKLDLTPDNTFKEHLEEWKGCASSMTKTELRKKIYSITLNDMLIPIFEELVYLGVPLENFSALGEENIWRLLDMMPTRKVDMHLREQWARNGGLTPKQSDLNDWCHIGSAICYSDFVVTEKQMSNLLSRSNEYSSKVTSNLSDLLSFKVA